MALVGISNEEKIWNYLKTKGLNDFGCAGLMGNLQAESALRPTNLQNTYEKKLGYTDDEYVSAVDSGRYTNFIKDKAGFGLAQWTYWSRKQNLLKYAQTNKKSIGDLEMQLDFLWSELTKSYKAVVSVLKKATSVREASDAVLLKYEKPANQGVSVQEKRESYGQAFYSKYSGTVSAEAGRENSNVDTSVITAYATNNDCYKAATPMAPKGIVVHSTGANNPNLKRYVDCVSECGENEYGNHWNNSSAKMGRKVCVHSFIGYDKNKRVRVANILPYNYACWGVGGGSNGSFNYNPQGHIQFEMCEDGLTDKSYCTEVYNAAVEYSAWLCKKYKLDPTGRNVIVSHKEAHALGYGSNHGDPDNWWKKHGYTMDRFRADVKAKVGGVSTNIPQIQPPTNTVVNTYKPRVAAPATSDKYWIHTSKGGMNSCILIGGNSCLPNCVGYAWGRWYELLGAEPKLSRANAENWYSYTADGYKRSATPELGAVICWRKGQAGNGNDGAGHVAIVEDIKSNGDIVTSNSAYGGTRFYMQTLTKASGYRIGSAYTFQGFILLPNKMFATEEVGTPYSTIEPYLVKVMASVLNIRKGPGTNYGKAGTIRDNGIYTIVEEASGDGATKWGLLKSKAGWISLDHCKKV